MEYSSAYHPQSDGQTDMVNRCVETYLRCLTGRQPKQWPKWLSWAEYWYNTNYHASLKSTPFEALYGRSPPMLVKGDVQLSAVEEVNRLTTERNVVLKEMQEQLLKAQDMMRSQANKHRREVEFHIEDRAIAYKLKLPEDSKVRPVFHVSLLKKVVAPNVEPQPLPSCMKEDWKLAPEPEDAMDTGRNEW
ncbi:hypothetical protein L195_g035599 [Trifolium pratense]|uniref:Integrase catalytic domain-containing protein n=1 Tax=Trifolium pratense TaxID=57577 RepID=A0A2K3LM58_TRIPR|nr:hypothetical protein L195_g035599 [Trifolium pratense]